MQLCQGCQFIYFCKTCFHNELPTILIVLYFFSLFKPLWFHLIPLATRLQIFFHNSRDWPTSYLQRTLLTLSLLTNSLFKKEYFLKLKFSLIYLRRNNSKQCFFENKCNTTFFKFFQNIFQFLRVIYLFTWSFHYLRYCVAGILQYFIIISSYYILSIFCMNASQNLFWIVSWV